METQLIELRKKDVEKMLEMHLNDTSGSTPESLGYWRGVRDVLKWLLDQPTFDQIS